MHLFIHINGEKVTGKSATQKKKIPELKCYMVLNRAKTLHYNNFIENLNPLSRMISRILYYIIIYLLHTPINPMSLITNSLQKILIKIVKILSSLGRREDL